MSDSSPSDPELDALIGAEADDFLRRIEHGELPDPEEYVVRHPEAATELRRALRSLRLVPVDVQAGPTTGVLGDFRIVREVGRGGMGVVYEAEQLSLGRRVALKVLPFAALSDSRLLQRFKNEARAAAALDHAHIVKVHAVGEERGVHFLAMQFIDGRPLSELIRERRTGSSELPLSASERGPGGEVCADAPTVTNAATESAPKTPRVARGSTNRSRGNTAYFRQVAEWGIQAADALEHAHSMGVVHRDIKPGNLLLDKSGQVWVADFGLAKVAASDAGVTASGDVLGTLRYMSPEQAGAKHGLVDHRSDVYSLGATLYELLTGVPAVDGKDKAEILHKIAFEEPILPRKLDRAIPAELETVVLKCLRKEPAERYATAGELAADLRRILAHEPVRAKRPTAAERIGKWLRRHSAVVLTASLVALMAMTIGTILVWRQSIKTKEAYDSEAAQRQEAEQNWELAEQTVEDMYGQVASKWLKDKRRLEPLQREFLEKALAFYERFAQKRGDRPAVRYSVGRARLRIGELSRRLDRAKQAEESLNLAAQALSALAAEFPEVPTYWDDLAKCLKEKGDLLTPAYRFAEAEECFRQAIGIWTLLADAGPEPARYRRELGNCYVSLGLSARQAGRATDAEATYRRAVAILEIEAAANPNDDAESKLANAHSNLAGQLKQDGQFPEAEEHCRKALAAQERLMKQRPGDSDVRSSLALTYDLYATLLRVANRPAAEEEALHRRAVAIQEELVEAHPEVSIYRSELAQALNNLGVFHNAHGDNPSAVRVYARAVGIQERLADEAPAIIQHQEVLAINLGNLGRAQIRSKQYAEAEKTLNRARAVAAAIVKDHPTLEVRRRLAICYYDIAALDFETRKPLEAVSALRESESVWESIVTDSAASAADRQELAKCLEGHAKVLSRSQQFADAITLVSRAIALREKLAEEAPADPARRENWAQDLYQHGEWLQRAGHPKEAEPAYRKAILLTEQVEADHPDRPGNRNRLAGCRNNLGVLLAEVGRPRDAEQILQQAAADYGVLADAAKDATEFRGTQAGVEANIGNLFKNLGEYALAEEQFRTALGHCPDSDMACNALADLILTRPDKLDRDVKEALRLAKKAVEADSKIGNYRNTLGLALYRSGDAAPAIKELTESMRLRDGGDSNDYFVLAMAHWNKGDKPEARKWFDKGVAWMDKNQPNDPMLKRFRAEAAELIGMAQSPTERGPIPREVR